MSKNFELLCRIEQAQGTIATESSPAFDVSAVLDGKRVSASTVKAGNSSRAEILKLIHVLFLSAPNAPHCVLFCGVGADDGSERVCVAVATALSNEVSSRVCLADTKIFGTSLQQLLELDEYLFPSPDPIEPPGSVARQIGRNLWFVSTEQLSSLGVSSGGTAQMCSGLQHLRQEFGYLLVHAPPIGTDSVASMLGQVTDGVVLVLEANTTRRVTARSAKQTLEAANVRLLGTVLNNRTFPIPEKLYRRL